MARKPGASLFVRLVFSLLPVSSASFAAASLAAEHKSEFRRPDTIPFPADNPYTPEKAALGKALYFDPRLSGAENMNCATCHNPSFGWEAPGKTAVGAQNTHLARKGPTILNVAWVHPFFWDGRAASPEEQAKGPIQAAAEMNLPLTEAVKRLESVPDYRSWFARVFPGQGVTGENITRAIATYERTVVASYAPFDRWVDGDETAISDQAKRGFALFTGKAQCVACHTGWNFSDNQFHDIGTSLVDIGRGKLEPDNPMAQYAFKTPSLRDAAQRAPYMHNGEFATLSAVLDHYAGGGVDRPSLSPLIKRMAISEAEKAELISFLQTLTGSRQVVALPVLPN
jgi:cytochrome c peroxidase